MLHRQVVVSGEAEQFKQEDAAVGVERRTSDFVGKRLDGCLQLSGLEKLQSIHCVLCGLVLLHVVARLDDAAETAIGLLFLVLDFDLGEIQGDLIDRDDSIVGAAARLVIAYQQIGHRDLQVLLLFFASLASDENRLLDVLAIRARQEKFRTGFADMGYKMKVLNADFPSSAASTTMHSSGLRCTEPPRLKVDFAFVFRVRAFAVNTVNLQKVIHLSHIVPPERLVNVLEPTYNRVSSATTSSRKRGDHPPGAMTPNIPRPQS